MGPLQAMDRSTVAAPLRRGGPASGVAARRLRAPALAFVALLVLAAALALLLRGGPSHTKLTTPRDTPLVGVPASARAQVSAVLGADVPAFAVRANAGGGLRASNAGQHLGASFAHSGVTLSARGIDVSLSLRALGVGTALHAIAPANPLAHANRVSYARGGALTEWYANGPAGLEQGFTLTRAPASAHAQSARLTLSLALRSNAHRSLAADGRSLTLRNGTEELRYGGLTATDASGHALRSRLRLTDAGVQIDVDAAGARYPLTIDPLIEAGGKLTAPSEGEGREEGEGLFGTSVALSADGGTLLVGGPHDTNPDDGAAWVFTRSGSAWVAQGGKLTGAEGMPLAKTEEEEQCAEESPDEAGECAFGASVALSADGDTALIGEPSATTRQGNAWVFKRTGSGAGATWTKTTILTGEGAGGEGRFGKSVALSADGSTALIGDPSANSQRGSAWVFALSGASATVQGKLIDTAAGHFEHVGRSVALSSDGATALIGAPGDAEYSGSALVFTRLGETWIQSPGKLTGEAETGQARFGKSVALSGDGATALVGGQNDNDNVGAAWGFVRSGSSFGPEGGKLAGALEFEAHFGAAVALSDDGSIGLIGAPRGGGGGLATEVVHTESTWTPLAEQLAGDEEIGKGWLGSAVALSSEGKLAVLGGPHDHARIGAAWMFSELPGVPPPPPSIKNLLPGFGPAGTAVKIKGKGFAGATAVSFGSTPAATFNVKSGQTIEAVAPAGEGTVDVTVQTPVGVSAINTGDNFHFTSGSGPGGSDNKGHGGPTDTPTAPTTTTTNTTGASGAKASGGVLGTRSVSAACQVTLRSKHLAVTRFRTVALRLLRSGTGACSGKLTLSFNVRSKGKRAKLKPIGTASYSISSSASKVFTITLNKAGRKLFRAHRGKLNVSLAIVRAVPAPALAKSASVRLTWKKTRKTLTLTK